MRYTLIIAGVLSLLVAFITGTSIVRRTESAAPYAFQAGVVLLAVGLATCDVVEAIKGGSTRPR